MKTKYRIVRDNYSGYEVQRKRWWFPIWLQVGINTHCSLERAEAFAEKQMHYVVKHMNRG